MSNLVQNGNFNERGGTTYVVYNVINWVSNGCGTIGEIVTISGVTFTQYAFIQTNLDNLNINQDILFPSYGRYTLSFYTRVNDASYISNESLNVSLGSVPLQTITYSTPGAWFTVVIPIVLNSPQSFTQNLKFQSSRLPGGVNNAINIVGISITYDIPCFMEGTLISCIKNDVETYVPIEQLVNNENQYLIKTLNHGHKPIKIIGKKTIYNSGNKLRINNRLYKLTTDKYPDLFSPLFITGNHAILVDSLTEKELKDSEDNFGGVFVTDCKYRLFACIDEMAEPYDKEGYFNIYHLALDTDDIYVNYGIYANGLLVESCCIYSIKKEKSEMDLHFFS